MSTRRKHRRALSMIELAVVIAIVAVLVALVLPALLSGRAAAREVTSIATLMNICNNSEHGPSSWWENGLLRGHVPDRENAGWGDPFRTMPISRDPALTSFGSLTDSDYPTAGMGYFYINFTDLQRQPLGDPTKPLFTDLRLPEDTQYVIIGVGRNGRLDMDPQRDIVLMKTPGYVHLVRRR